MSSTISVAADKFNNATLRISCAGSLIAAIQCAYDKEDALSNAALVEALHGVSLLLEDANNNLVN